MKLEQVFEMSELRENILKWYPFKENSTVLEIGANTGEITGILTKKCNEVYSVEENKEKREKISKRYSGKENLKILSKIEEIPENKKFDYITFIGTLENVKNITEELISVRKYLNLDGIILLAIDNKLGFKYLTKKTEENSDILVERKLYDLEELTSKIEEAGFKNKKMYYPMPDYKLPNVIFTDKRPLTKDELSRNIVYYDEETIKFFDENELYRRVLKENGENFPYIANSFFVEIFNNEFIDNNIKLVTFSNMRKDKYRVMTVMKDEFVYKYAENKESREHLNNIKKVIEILKKSKLNTLDSYNDESIISKYTSEKTVDKIIIELLKEDKKQEAISLMKNFKQELLNKLEKTTEEKNVFDKYNVSYDKEEMSNIIFVKYGLWDAIFQNCFYIDNQFYFYDQEWKEENVPIDFILYRAVKYFDVIEKYISKEKIYEILELNQNQIKIFDELDDRIQEEIRDNTIWKINTQGKTLLDLKRDKLTDNHTINLLRMENKDLKEENNKLIEEKNELNEKINNILQSKSWKITEPLRKIKRMTKNK